MWEKKICREKESNQEPYGYNFNTLSATEGVEK